MTLNKIKIEPSHTWAMATFNDLLEYSNFLMINSIPLQSRCAHCQFNLHLHDEIMNIYLIDLQYIKSIDNPQSNTNIATLLQLHFLFICEFHSNIQPETSTNQM